MSSSLPLGARLGRYEIKSQLGAGGMGEVYLAQDTKLDRNVALKILPADVAAHPDRMKRFVQEAKSASALNHPNIITIHEIGQTDSVHFIATEFIDGHTLRERMQSARMKLGEVLDVAAQIASALSAAHAAGIAHRDIKPENIMLRRDGIVKVLDFGLAKLTERLPPDSVDTEAPTSFKTDPGTVVGTVIYMSPEQARGLNLDARTDIFSLGVVLYEMVAGCLPFAGSTSSKCWLRFSARKSLSHLARYSREVPAELERIVSKALRKNREQRYQTIQDLLLDLKSLTQELEFEKKLERSAPQKWKSEADTREREAAETVMGSARLKRDAESAQVAISAKPEAKTEADAPPTGNKAVYAFLELFALAFTFEGAGALLRGESLWKIAGAWLIAVIFFVAGIRWPKIRLLLEQRFGSRPDRIAPDRIANVPRDRTGVTFTPRNLIVPAAAVVIALAAAAYFYLPRAVKGPIDSVAVLPFVNQNNDPNTEYLSDGITESIINSLLQLPNLKVMSRNSVFHYKGKDMDAQTVARELKVQAVLTGRVTQRGDGLSISVELINAQDNSQIWGQQYNRKLADVFAVQEEMAKEISEKLRLKLTGAERQQLAKRPTENL